MFLSESKTATQQIAETVSKSLAIVELSPENQKKMDAFYLQRVQRKSFEEIGIFATQTVARLHATYDLFAFLLLNAATFEDMLDVNPDEFVQRVQTRLSMHVTQISQLEGKLSKETKAKLIESLSAVGGAIVKPSKRFSGGMDIIHTGTPCATSPQAAAGSFNFFSPPPESRIQNEQGEEFERKNLEDYSTPLSVGVLRAANQIQQAIFGNIRKAENVFDPDVSLVSVTFDWSAINAIIASIHPIFNRVDVNLFKNFDAKLAANIEPFMSLGLRRMPLGDMVRTKINQLKYNTEPTNLFNPVVLQINIGFEAALVTSIEQPLVNYIVQGSDQKVMSLYRWYQAWGSFNLRISGQAKGAIRKASAVPRYVTSATKIPELENLRKEFHYNVSDVDADKNGLTLMPNGMPAVLPNKNDIDLDAVKEYEAELERVQSLLYAKSVPLSVHHSTLRTNFYQCMTDDLDFDTEIQKESTSLSRFGNTCVGTDPNFNIVVMTDSSGLSVQGTRTIGAKKPSALDLADGLGYDFAQPGEAPNFRTAGQYLTDVWESGSGNSAYRPAIDLMFRTGQMEKGQGRFVSACDGKSIAFTQGEAAQNMYRLLCEIASTYGYLVGAGRLPNPQDITKEAMAALGYDTPESIVQSEYDNGLYLGLIDNDGTAHVIDNDNEMWLMRIVTRVLNDAAGLRGSNLMSSSIRELGSLDAAIGGLESSTHYFSIIGASKFADMARISNYLGGMILNLACGAIADLDKKVLYADISRDPSAPPAKQLQQHILPMAVMINKVLPHSLEIFEAAEAEQERTHIDTSITAEEIRIPGLASGVALLPHQLKVHQSLRKRPKYAVLFVAPGGGKTILGLTDIGALTQELQDVGEEAIRPLIVCPTNLVSTWADDCRKFMPDWNIVPITADTVNTWGEERMYEVLNSAPRNTIFVAGLSFLSTGSFNVDIGGVRIQIRGAVEFINRFNFGYVLLDESHKVKNYKGGQVGSQTHFNSKLIFTAPSVRYARLATGTFVTDRVSDVVGQAALLSPSIFGDDLGIVDQGDGTLAMIRRAHSRMSNHTAFISMKRKEWAFMLPNPVDTFIPVQIDDPDVPNSELHMQTYEAMYRQVLEKLDEAAKSAKGKKSDDDDDSPEADGGDVEFNEDEMDDEDILGKLLAGNADLNMYFQRMEMLLTDPMGDEVARTTFEAAGVTNFTSAKVVAVIDRIKKHFEVQTERNPEESEHQIFMWKPGVTPRELDIAVYDGVKYLARKQSDDFKRQTLPPSIVPPPEDPDYWKEERSGKLIVFTRYVRSANAVYNALPDEYKRVALVFHGEVGKLGQNKEANLDAFKTDDRYQIIIANEQAISEGHNMQMGSRIIRVDTPWSPGTYDQSTARIFRPDVAAATIDENGKPGDMPREVVFVDWIMTSGTLEVGKVARLMWKTVEKIQFDEKGNPRYDAINDFELPKISMNASLLIDNNTIDDFMDYFQAKRALNEIEASEFAEMRKSTVAQMIPLTPVPPLSDFKVLTEVPIVANQKIPDRNGWGLERLLDWAKEKSFANGEDLKTALHRKPVVTEFGNGIIVGLNVRNVEGKLREDNPISTVRVRLAGTEELITLPATKIHVATAVSKADLDTFFKVRKAWATETERKKVTAAAEVLAEEQRKQDETQTTATIETIEETVVIARETARKAKRVANVEAKKPINEGVSEAGKEAGAKRVKELAEVTGRIRRVRNLSLDDLEPAKKDEAMKIKMKPMIYNGFIALEAEVTNPDERALKQLEFVHFGAYAYIDFQYYSDFDKFLDFVEETKKLEFDNATAKRLEFAMHGFEETGRMTFNSKHLLKQDAQLKQFFLVRHRTANDRKHIKAYPMVLPDRLRVMIDLATNPRAASWVGVKIAGTRKWGKFEKSDGMWITFTKTIPSAKKRMNDVIKAGYPISNLKSATEALSKIRAVKKTK